MILDPAKGRSPHEVVNFITSAFKKEFGEADPLEVEAIRGMNLRELFLKYDASEREVRRKPLFYLGLKITLF